MLCKHDSPTFKSQAQSKQCATPACTCTLRSVLQQNAQSQNRQPGYHLWDQWANFQKKSPSHSYDDPATLKLLSAKAQLSRKQQICPSPQDLMATNPSSLSLPQSSGQCHFAQHRAFQARCSLILWDVTDTPLFFCKECFFYTILYVYIFLFYVIDCLFYMHITNFTGTGVKVSLVQLISQRELQQNPLHVLWAKLPHKSSGA